MWIVVPLLNINELKYYNFQAYPDLLPNTDIVPEVALKSIKI